MPESQPTLTDEQRLVLGCAAFGLTSMETAELHDYSTAEVRRLLNEAIMALGARSKLEAVLLASRQGLLERRSLPPDFYQENVRV